MTHMVRVEGVSKKFCQTLKRSMWYGAVDATRSMLRIPYRSDELRQGEFWALDKVSIDVARGEKVGFLGVNGSGKTTLLRLIGGILPPDGGTISVHGSVGALVAVGVGFHPHMTGRENIYLNGTILGMGRQELEQKIDAIVAFAEIGDFIDAPVSTYSSGMAVRLGFSIAIHRVPDIMLVDEVLAVGDLAFQLKCYKRLAEYRQSGGTFIIVSHSMQLIRNACERVVWLDKGRVVEDGDVYTVCDHYETELLERAKQSYEDRGVKNVLNYDDDVHIEAVDFLDQAGAVVTTIPACTPLTVRVRVRTKRPIDAPMLTISMCNSAGVVVFEVYSHREIGTGPSISGERTISVRFEDISLKPDIYFVSVTLSEGDILNKLEWHERSYMLRLESSGHAVNQGLVCPHPEWTFD
jgi:homopolymeric O-antigen transport system ATP-binding protein